MLSSTPLLSLVVGVAVGMDGWMYRIAYTERPEDALAAVQEREFDEDLLSWTDRTDTLPRPTSMAELEEFKERQAFWEFGTGSILDMDRLVDADEEDHDGAVRPLSAAELQQYLSTDRPSASDFEVAIRGALGDYWLQNPDSVRRWCGRYTILYRDGRPDEYVFWGYSGD
jgi:hypothetical protein